MMSRLRTPADNFGKTEHKDNKSDVSFKAMNLDYRLKELEKGIIIDALKQSAGVQKKAAETLGIKERSLWHRIKKYDIDATSFKHHIS